MLQLLQASKINFREGVKLAKNEGSEAAAKRAAESGAGVKDASGPLRSKDSKRSIRHESVRLICVEAFLMVAKHGSYADAAKEMGTDPTQVSRYLRDLEEWVGLKLIVKGEGLDMTPQGHEFLPKAGQVLNLMNGSRPKFHRSLREKQIECARNKELRDSIPQYGRGAVNSDKTVFHRAVTI